MIDRHSEDHTDVTSARRWSELPPSVVAVVSSKPYVEVPSEVLESSVQQDLRWFAREGVTAKAYLTLHAIGRFVDVDDVGSVVLAHGVSYRQIALVVFGSEVNTDDGVLRVRRIRSAIRQLELANAIARHQQRGEKTMFAARRDESGVPLRIAPGLWLNGWLPHLSGVELQILLKLLEPLKAKPLKWGRPRAARFQREDSLWRLNLDPRTLERGLQGLESKALVFRTEKTIRPWRRQRRGTRKWILVTDPDFTRLSPTHYKFLHTA